MESVEGKDMKKISKVLKDSTTPQIKYALIDYGVGNEVRGKCAMGELACASGVPALKLSNDKPTPSYSSILLAYGIPIHTTFPSLCFPRESNVFKKGWDFDEEEKTLYETIVRLNDAYSFTFAQIGEFLVVTFDL